MFTNLVLALMIPVQTTLRAVEGLSNGDFELIGPSGTLGSSSNPVDGGYWVGAEGRTVQSGLTRVLRFGSAAAATCYQRVGCAKDLVSSFSLTASAKIGASNDAGYVTFAEADGPVHSMYEALLNCPGFAPWRFTEQIGSNTYSLNCDQTSPNGNLLDWGNVILAAGSIVAEWQAPTTGTVRVTLRAPRLPDTNPLSVTHEIRMGSSLSTSTLIRSDPIDDANQNGNIIVARIPISAGQSIFFRVTYPGGTGTAVFQWLPYISYEGRRVTWVFSKSTTLPPNTATQTWIRVPAAVGTWATMSNVAAGTVFSQQFPAQSPAQPPVLIELGVPSSNAAITDFDNLSCKVNFDYEDAQHLRTDTLDAMNWAMTLVRLRQDRNDNPDPQNWNGPGPWTLGSIATPYVVHGINTYNGPQQSNCSLGPVYGVMPLGLHERLSRVFYPPDHDDYFFIREGERRHKSSVGLLYSQYDACADSFPQSSTETTGSAVISEMVWIWQHTNDPTALDVAAAYADVVSANGVYNYTDPITGPDPRNGLVLSGPYTVSTGANPNANAPGTTAWGQIDTSTTHLIGSVDLLNAYCACKRYNTDHPTAPRYTSTQLATWLSVAKNGVRVAAILKHYPDNAWIGTWVNDIGYFNDTYGYLAGQASLGLKAIGMLPQPLTTDESNVQYALWHDLMKSGADYYIDKWEQQVVRSAMASGDNGRCWPSYLDLVPYVDSTTATRYQQQVLRAGIHARRFQYPGGTWTTANQCSHEIYDATGSFSTPLTAPAVYPWGMGQSFRVSTLSSSDRDDILATLKTILRVTLGFYRESLAGGYLSWSFGFRHTADVVPPPAGESGGFEQRCLQNYMFILDNLPLTLPTPPDVSASPASFSTPGPQGIPFTFTIHVPSAADHNALDDAVHNRTRVQRWRYDSASNAWLFDPLWPQNPNGFFQAPVYNDQLKTVSITTTNPIGSGAGEFKFNVHTWDTVDQGGQWDEDTSYQIGW